MKAVKSQLSLDPVTLEIVWGRLQAVIDEAEVTLMRTAFSPIIREAFDFGVVLLDSQGGSVSQSQRSMPSFVGTLPRTMQAALERFPASTWQPGDVLGTNDPWLGTGHLPDMTMVRPVFRSGRIVAYVGCIGHWADIGGAIWSADSRELFEEGLRIPLSKIRNRGKVNDDLLSIVLANVRLPEQVRGDIYAQLATLDVGAQRLTDLLDEMSLDDPASIFNEIETRSESAMRAAIREVPNGTYRHEMELDGVDGPLVLRAAVTIEDESIVVDWTGSSPQTQWAINDSFNHAYAMTVYPIKCALLPDVPNNQGSYRPITMVAPEGTIINCRFPAAVASRQIIGHSISATVFGALAQILPDRVLADSGSPCPRFVISGMFPDGRKWGSSFLLSGGMGAKNNRDGLSAAPWPSNAGTTSAEIVESTTELLFRRRALVPNSGGDGTYRGGLGVATDIELRSKKSAVLSMMTDRVTHPPLGRHGGHPAAPNILTRSGGGSVPPKGRTELQPGEVLSMRTPGGGGFGPPEARDPEQRRRDIEFGYVTAE
ncbi:MAG: hydantoinase B/oxoprolinase family protein [Chloroflexi bacterium]|nr:MAG: hydantoinase B/oxoprolinase family protein [Chloroflexota bacterium]